MTHYLTRAELDRQAPEHALGPLLDPKDRDLALDAHRRLVWTMFPDRDAKRDFLWRSDGRGKFLVLSAQKPQDKGLRLFKPFESKQFAPDLAVGDQLSFILRANATRDRRSVPNEETVPGTNRRPRKNRRVDIVMHAMREQELRVGVASLDSRAARRINAAEDAALTWISDQGKRRGFSIDGIVVEDYRVRRLKRSGGKDATLGVLDLRGLLTVSEPDVFTNALLTGFGRAKAFGCGLMLVRRA